MVARSDQIQKSRLGRLLVIRGFITEQQLDNALAEQRETGLLLGEVLLAKGWVNEKQLNQALKQQKRYRKMATVVAMVAAPLQPMMALAASPSAVPLNNTRIESAEVGEFGKIHGLRMLDDEEMAGVNAQGFFSNDVAGLNQLSELTMNPNFGEVSAGLHNLYRDQDDDDENKREEQIAHQLNDTVLTLTGFGPISQMLDSDLSIEGVKYHEGHPPIEFLADGGIRYNMPAEIARISMENIRVKGSDDPETMGSIYMSDIKFYPGSHYTISAKRD